MDPQLNGLIGCNPQHNNEDHNNSPSTTQKRQRAKQACEPCRLRKRRCNGEHPCNMCTQFEYKCYFEKHPRKRSKLVEQNEAFHEMHEGLSSTTGGAAAATATGELSRFEKPEPSREDRPSVEDATKLRSMEANSGIAFTRLLGLRLDPSSGPKLFTFGWNLGSSTFTVPDTPPVTDFLTQDQMFGLSQLYFAHVHPLYGFLDRNCVLEQMAVRWQSPEACQVPDHIFAGIAALGILWSDGALNSLLPGIVDSAKRALESTSTMQPPCLMDVQSWILRTLYLRCTDHPHSVWMATCTTMHLVESTGIFQESSNATLHPHASDHLNDPEIRRRSFWIARMLNTWVSFEYGRTRVQLRGITCQLPTSKEGDYTSDYINLYSLSCALDPDRSSNGAQVEDFVKQLEAYEARHDGIQLSKANLALCSYRRIRLANPNLSNEIASLIINMGLRGLQAAQTMSAQGAPWWHVANVPFQVICVFLAMDVRESLAHIAHAMRVLEEVVEKFRTVAMKEALKTARFLVRLSKKRKDEDSDVLGSVLKKAQVVEDPQPENLRRATVQGMQVNGGDAGAGAAGGAGSVVAGGANGMKNETPMTTSSNEDWSMDILNNSDFDWNYFLTADMPAFQNFAPDGTM